MDKNKVDIILSRENIISICTETLNWCLEHFGASDNNMKPTLKISYDKRVKRIYGSYLLGIITVYPNVCITPKLLIRTILHEYRHFLQMPNNNTMELYYTLSEQFNYVEHPLEIDSDVFEEKHYDSCKKHLKKIGIL
jgi:hypothetical protein